MPWMAGLPTGGWTLSFASLEYFYTWTLAEGVDCPDTAGIASSSWLNIYDDVDICLDLCLVSKARKCIPDKKSLGQGRLSGEE